MSDVTLKSDLLNIQDFPKETERIIVLYDDRGWAIRCYGGGKKLTTMIPVSSFPGEIKTLVPREQVELACK